LSLMHDIDHFVKLINLDINDKVYQFVKYFWRTLTF
jgi:hypothetical protein